MVKYRQGKSGLYVPSSYRASASNVVHFWPLRIWAEEGLVCAVVDDPDSKDHGRLYTMHPDEAEKKFKKVLKSAGTSSDLGGIVKDRQGLQDLRRVADGLVDVIREAREQGPSRIISEKDMKGPPNVGFVKGRLYERDDAGNIIRDLS